jgi:DNA-binding CsgD family transcriptional regulator
MTFGYALDSEVTDLAIPLESDRPVADALRKKKIVIGNKKELFEKYSEVQDVDNRSSWASTAAIPTHSGYVFAFLLQCTIEEPEHALLYFRAVCALLGFYNFEEVRARQLTRERVKNQLQNARVFASKGSPLTERQELITDLIKKSKTNGQIGQMLGYSESLIRQETIIIYQKLGIEGRRELIQNKDSDQP